MSAASNHAQRPAARVLIAGPDPVVRTRLGEICRDCGLSASEVEASDAVDAVLERARTENVDVLLLDLELASVTTISGQDLLAELTQLEGAPSVVLLAREADVETAVRAMREGATDFLVQPVDRATLEPTFQRVLRRRAVACERDRLSTRISSLMSGPIVGQSRSIARLLEQVERVAATPHTTVLIQGESGVGKELVARAIHEHSARRNAPFVALNCASLTESLLESELFGYEAGAFTGASSRGRKGLIATAEGGTLLLDEIGELDPGLQARLLRVLQERTYRRVGGSQDLPMNVRVVASTNRDLETMVEAGTFREDLFYRLNVMSLRVPALRQRSEDVPLLAQHFLDEVACELGRELSGFSAAAAERLEAYPWPGNVRELRNAIERAAILTSGGLIEVEHLEQPEHAQSKAVVADTSLALPLHDRSIRSMEEALIRRVLSETEGNRSQAARLLGVNRTTLYNKLRAYAIEA